MFLDRILTTKISYVNYSNCLFVFCKTADVLCYNQHLKKPADTWTNYKAAECSSRSSL